MSSEITVKIQSLLWWVSSIAVSVLCCSVLFVFFASSMVDVKTSVQNNDAHLTVLDARLEKAFSEIEALQKRLPAVAPQTVVQQPATSPAAPPAQEVTAPVAIAPSAPQAETAPVVTPPVAPAPVPAQK